MIFVVATEQRQLADVWSVVRAQWAAGEAAHVDPVLYVPMLGYTGQLTAVAVMPAKR
jgi:hypothetical protein